MLFFHCVYSFIVLYCCVYNSKDNIYILPLNCIILLCYNSKDNIYILPLNWIILLYLY